MARSRAWLWAHGNEEKQLLLWELSRWLRVGAPIVEHLRPPLFDGVSMLIPELVLETPAELPMVMADANRIQAGVGESGRPCRCLTSLPSSGSAPNDTPIGHTGGARH